MIDISVLNKYIVELEQEDYDAIEAIMRRCNALEWIKAQLDRFLDCSKCFLDGRRIIQTNEYRYCWELTRTLYVIEHYENNEDYLYEDVLNLHNRNLEFEAINGFEYEVRGNTRTIKKTKKSKQTKLDLGDKPKKESKAEAKLKATAAKLGAISFNFNSIKDDTI